jgi:hypothetical protein
VHPGSKRRCGDVVKDIVADDDVEAAANAARVERGDVATADVPARAVAPHRVRARLETRVFEMRALAPQRRAPESLAATHIQRGADTPPEQLLGQRDERAGDAYALGRCGNTMPRMAVPAIVVRLAEAVGQTALLGISTRCGVAPCTLSR